jgi:molybdate transport system substrate-binding protein
MLVSNAVKTTMEELGFGATSEVKTLIEKGAAFDVAILTPAALDALVEEGKVSAAGRADIAGGLRHVGSQRRTQARHQHHCGIQAGAAESQIDRLLEAGAGAPYLKSLFERLGIADQIKSNLSPYRPPIRQPMP